MRRRIAAFALGRPARSPPSSRRARRRDRTAAPARASPRRSSTRSDAARTASCGPRAHATGRTDGIACPAGERSPCESPLARVRDLHLVVHTGSPKLLHRIPAGRRSVGPRPPLHTISYPIAAKLAIACGCTQEIVVSELRSAAWTDLAGGTITPPRRTLEPVAADRARIQRGNCHGRR